MTGLPALPRAAKVVVAGNFIAVAARMSLVTFLGIYFVREAGIALPLVGMAYLCESVLRGVLAPMYGALSDRIGRKPLLLFGAIGTGIVLPSFLLVEGAASLFGWSLAMGVVGGISWPVSGALLLDLVPAERRQSVLAVNYTGMSVAYTLGVMPAGYVAEKGYGLLAALTATGFVLVALLYAVWLRDLPRPERPRGNENFAASTLAVFRDRVFLGFAALGFVFPLGMGLVISASPIYGADIGLGEGYIGLVLGGNSIIVALLAVPVASRIEASGPFRHLGATGAVVAAAFLCYAAIPSPAAALLAGTIVFSFAELVFSSAMPAAVSRLAPAGRRGAYQGGWALVASVSMGSALFFSGTLRDALGWPGTWLAYAGLMGCAGVALYALRGRFQRFADTRHAA